MKITNRLMTSELIDLGHYELDEYRDCMQKMFKINKLLGFFSRTRYFLKKLGRKSVLDIGCGNGLFLLNLARKFPEISFKGIDISADAILMSQEELEKHPAHNINFERLPSSALPSNSFDIVITTLVCHHLTDDELIQFLQQILNTASTAVIINDLHRHPLAYGLYRIISPLFHNRLITHDGLISIQRAFTRNDWISLLKQAGIRDYQLKWRFPFCWSVILWKKSSSSVAALQD